MISIPKFYTGGFGSLSGLLRNVTAPALAKAAAPAPVAPPAPQAFVGPPDLVGPPVPATVAPAKTTSAPSVSTPTITPVDKLVLSGGVSAPAPTPAPTISRDQLMADVVAGTMGPPAPSPQQIAANVAATKARLAAEPTTPASTTQQPSGISLTNAAPSTTPTIPPKIATTVDPSTGFPILDRNAIDTVFSKLSNNPTYVRSAGKNIISSNAYRDNFDKFGWNVKSDASSILRGRAIFGLNYGYTNAQLMQAAKALGIPIDDYYKTENQRGRIVTVIDSKKLLGDIDKKTDGMYVVTNSVDGTNKHATVFYRDDGTGRLIPQKDVDGKPAATFFTAERNEKSNWYDAPLQAIRVGGPMIVSALVTGNPNFTMTQQLALNAGAQLIAGADPETVLRSVIGSISSSQVPEFLKEVQVIANADPVLKSALINSAVQATYSTFLPDENIALNAIAGAIGGTAAELAGDLGDPALEKAIGEYFKNRTLGMSDFQAGFAAAQDYAQSLVAIDSKNRSVAQNQVIDAFSQPKSAGVGTQLGEATAAAGAIYSDPEAAREAARMGIELASVGVTTPSLISDKELPAVTVTGTREPVILTPTITQNLGMGGRVDKKTPTTVPPNLDIANLISQGASTTGKTTETPSGVIDTTQPTGTSSDAGVSASNLGTGANFDSKIIDLTGIGGGGTNGIDFGGGKGISGTEAAGTGASGIGTGETGAVGTGTDGTGTGGDGEGGDGSGDGTTETASQTFPLTPQQQDTVILDLISGGGTRRGQRVPTAAESESMAALTQALRIGDPGDALFGGKLGRRRNVWNVESLRLKDELGG